MDGLTTLIAAYAEEDRRLMELVESFPLSSRDVVPRHFKYSLKQTLGHLAFWDNHAIGHFEALCNRASVEAITIAEFEERHKHQLKELIAEPWAPVLESYRAITSALLKFLAEHWENLDEPSRENFKIPLKHRRYHRRKLGEMLAVLSPPVDGDRAGAATGLRTDPLDFL